MSIKKLLNDVPILPVITLSQAEDALPLVETLLLAGIRDIEITLRTECACKAIAAIKATFKESVMVGAGSITSEGRLAQAIEAGSDFVVTPGCTANLLQALQACPVPALPGIATPSELLYCQEAGFTSVKFFPAAYQGGVGFLKSMLPLFPDISFCPTGGINAENMAHYLALPNVFCVGGGWICPPSLIASQDWAAIKTLVLNGMASFCNN